MLATIRDDTWNMLNMQQIIPNWKRWYYSDIPGGGHNRLKDPFTWLKVATTLEKPPTPTHWVHTKFPDARETTMPVDVQFPQLHPNSSDIPTDVELNAQLIKCYHLACENLKQLLNANRRSMTYKFHKTPIVQAKLWWSEHHKLQN